MLLLAACSKSNDNVSNDYYLQSSAFTQVGFGHGAFTYNYDAGMRLTSRDYFFYDSATSTASTSSISYQYAADGKIGSEWVGNFKQTEFTRDAQGRVTLIKRFTQGTPAYTQEEYTYYNDRYEIKATQSTGISIGTLKWYYTADGLDILKLESYNGANQLSYTTNYTLLPNKDPNKLFRTHFGVFAGEHYRYASGSSIQVLETEGGYVTKLGSSFLPTVSPRTETYVLMQ